MEALEGDIFKAEDILTYFLKKNGLNTMAYPDINDFLNMLYSMHLLRKP